MLCNYRTTMTPTPPPLDRIGQPAVPIYSTITWRLCSHHRRGPCHVSAIFRAGLLDGAAGSQEQPRRSSPAQGGGCIENRGYVRMHERKSWKHIRGESPLPPPYLLTGPEHGLVNWCKFKTTCNGSRQLSIEPSSPDLWDTAALDSANYS
jgi:hypothetical protein